MFLRQSGKFQKQAFTLNLAERDSRTQNLIVFRATRSEVLVLGTINGKKK